MSSEQSKGVSTEEWSADELIPFGRYILLERIASGATAAVYRANVRGEAGFERLVAIKRILPHMAGDPEFVTTFVREAKTTARLTHQNVCPIYELGKVGESLYMAMECVIGKDLGQVRRRLEERQMAMPPVAAAWIGARLCDALDYAHTLRDQSGNNIGIIHRDLSPTNIVISYEGEAKLIDFGLAKAVGRAQQTNVDALKQKLGYMSPEMVRGRPIDARSDIFGVGIALYEMLTGRRLFAGKDDIATLKLVGKASVPPPSALLEDPPDDLELIIMRALERDPDDRWQTAAEMAEVLNVFVREQDMRFGQPQMAEFLRELFGDEIDADRARIQKLLKASADPKIIRERRAFFSSPSGAAARAKAEVARRMSARPPRGQRPSSDEIPAAPPVPAIDEAGAHPPRGLFSKPVESPAAGEEEPTGFYGPGGASSEFEDEPTGFYDGDSAPRQAAEPARSGPFADEPTQFLGDNELDSLTLEEETLGGGFDDEEPTEIYFNKEEGLGIPEMLREIHDVDLSPGPLNRPIVAPDLAETAPVFAAAVPAPPTPLGVRPARTTVEIPARARGRRSRRWTWSTLIVIAALLGSAALLVTQTPLGIAIGLRSAPSGTIEVRTRPDVGAPVTLDGVYRGRSPLRMSGVKPGLRRIGVEAEGFLPASRQTEVRSNRTSMIEIELQRSPAAPAQPAPGGAPTTQAPTTSQEGASAQEASGEPAEEETQPEGDATEVPGEPHDRGPHREPRRSPAHSTRSDSPESAATVPAATASADPTLGSLVIHTVPWAYVMIDGQPTGRTTPLLGFSLPPGSHLVDLRTEDGRLHRQRIQATPGRTVRIMHRF